VRKDGKNVCLYQSSALALMKPKGCGIFVSVLDVCFDCLASRIYIFECVDALVWFFFCWQDREL